METLNYKPGGNLDLNDPKFQEWIETVDKQLIPRDASFTILGLMLYEIAKTLKIRGVSEDVISSALLSPSETFKRMGSDYVVTKYRDIEIVRHALGEGEETFEEYMNDEYWEDA